MRIRCAASLESCSNCTKGKGPHFSRSKFASRVVSGFCTLSEHAWLQHHPDTNFSTGHRDLHLTIGSIRAEWNTMIAFSDGSSRAHVAILHTGRKSIVLASLVAVVLSASWLFTLQLSSQDELKREPYGDLVFYAPWMHEKLVHEGSGGIRFASMKHFGHNNNGMQFF